MGPQSLPLWKLLPSFTLTNICFPTPPTPPPPRPASPRLRPLFHQVDESSVCVFLLHQCRDPGRKIGASFCLLELHVGAGLGGPSGNVKCTSRHVSFCQVHCWSLTVEWEPSRTFLLEAGPCLFERMKAALSRSVDLG